MHKDNSAYSNEISTARVFPHQYLDWTFFELQTIVDSMTRADAEPHRMSYGISLTCTSHLCSRSASTTRTELLSRPPPPFSFANTVFDRPTTRRSTRNFCAGLDSEELGSESITRYRLYPTTINIPCYGNRSNIGSKILICAAGHWDTTPISF